MNQGKKKNRKRKKKIVKTKNLGNVASETQENSHDIDRKCQSINERYVVDKGADDRKDLQQIIRANWVIYVVKLLVFILITLQLFEICPEKMREQQTMVDMQSFFSVLTFVSTTLIDNIVLFVNHSIKGVAKIIGYGYLAVLTLAAFFVLLIRFELFFQPTIENYYYSLGIVVFCCLSPIVELIFYVVDRVQNERDRGMKG